MPTPSASLIFNFQCVDQFTAAEAPAASGVQIAQSAFNKTFTLNSATTPPVTLDAFFTPTLSAGSLVIDLTSVFKLGGGAQDATGKKLVGLFFANIAANSVELGPDAANGYPLFGGTNKMVAPAGSYQQFYFGAALPVVSGTAKRLLLGAGTGTQQFQMALVFG